MPACQADASLVVVADFCDEIFISLLDISYSFILIDYYNCLSYKHDHVSYMSSRYVFPCIVSSFDLEFGHLLLSFRTSGYL